VRDVSLLAGLRALARNAKFWAAVFCMSVPLGVSASASLLLCRCVLCLT
jgi:hypothetical protein